jgi:hypothetical protein
MAFSSIGDFGVLLRLGQGFFLGFVCGFLRF